MAERHSTRQSVQVATALSRRQGRMKALALRGRHPGASRIAEHITEGEPTSKLLQNNCLAGLTDSQAKAIAEYVKTLN
jgi:hypothetical protein